jgi:hypothetical protein
LHLRKSIGDDDDDDDDDGDMNGASESIREKSKASATDNLGYCELKQNKLWFDEE